MADTQASGNGEMKRRGPGRLPKGQKIMSPAKIETMTDLWLQGLGTRAIASRLKVSRGSINYYLAKTVKPQLRERMHVRAEEEIAKLCLLERTAWLEFAKGRKGKIAYLELTHKCIELRCRIGGLMIDRHEIEHKGGIRLCGRSPSEFDSETISEILRRVAQRRAGQAELDSHRPEELN